MPDQIQSLIEIALKEDIGSGDITTEALFGSEPLSRSATIIAKEELVLAGIEIARRVFAAVDERLAWQRYFEDGSLVREGQPVAKVTGSLQGLLRGERVALNFLRHLSGVATFTRRFVEKVRKFPVQILDTRKTTPGMRAMEKHAVRAGGGKNHRIGLYDRFLIKDNHLKAIPIREAVGRAKAKNPNRVPIEVEVDSLGRLEEALDSGADILMLDNFSLKDLKKAVSRIAGKVKTEASGGITLENVIDYAKTGVDFISIGALTHSAPAVDLSLEIGH